MPHPTLISHVLHLVLYNNKKEKFLKCAKIGVYNNLSFKYKYDH